MTLSGLIERVSAATGPDRALDREIEGALTHGAMMGNDRFTESLDSALALCERVLPGWRWVMDDHSGPNGDLCGALVFGYVETRLYPDGERVDFDATAPTPALALVLAALRTLQAGEAGK